MFEPVNGYQIRRELVSWQVDRWAHVNPGSIYNGLGRLTRRGCWRRTDVVDAGPGGRDLRDHRRRAGELESMVIVALESVDAYDRVAFHVAFSMLPLVPHEAGRSPASPGAGSRSSARWTRSSARRTRPENGPPHARRAWVLWMDMAVAELALAARDDRGHQGRAS